MVFNSKSSSHVSPLSSLLKITVKKCCNRSPTKRKERVEGTSVYQETEILDFSTYKIPDPNK